MVEDKDALDTADFEIAARALLGAEVDLFRSGAGQAVRQSGLRGHTSGVADGDRADRARAPRTRRAARHIEALRDPSIIISTGPATRLAGPFHQLSIDVWNEPIGLINQVKRRAIESELSLKSGLHQKTLLGALPQ